MKKILEKLNSLRFHFCNHFHTEIFYTPDERYFFRELDKAIEESIRGDQ